MGYIVRINTVKVFRGEFKPIHIWNWMAKEGYPKTFEAFTIRKTESFIKDALFPDYKRYLIFKERQRYNKLKNSAGLYGDVNKEYSDAIKKMENWEDYPDFIEKYENENYLLTFRNALRELMRTLKKDYLGNWKQKGVYDVILSIMEE